MPLLDILYRFFVLNEPPDTVLIIDAYIKVLPESSRWKQSTWDREMPNIPAKLVQNLAALDYVPDREACVRIVRYLMDAKNSERETNEEYFSHRVLNERRTTRRLHLSQNPKNMPSGTETNSDLRDLTVICNTQDTLGYFVTLPYALHEQLGDSIIQITNVLNWRRVYARVAKDPDNLERHQLSLPIGLFLQLGGTEETEELLVNAILCSDLPMIASVTCEVIGEVDNILKNTVISRIKRRIHTHGLSRGMEIHLWPRVSVVISRLEDMDEQEVFAGTAESEVHVELVEEEE